MLELDYSEFYITNVCNLSCSGCNRFNNYNFRGRQRWADLEPVYREWSKSVSIRHCAVLGGEPLLNADVNDWCRGILELWPDTYLRLITNGYRIEHRQDLYNLNLEYKDRFSVWVGVHNEHHVHDVSSRVKQWQQEPIVDTLYDQDPYNVYRILQDVNGISTRIEYNWWFHQGTIIDQLGVKRLHNSDPEMAHANCNMKNCHHWQDGKLYKCGVVALLPEFDKQHQLVLSNSDRELMQSYQPLAVDSDNKDQFFDNLDNSIPQCKFCPQQYNGDQIYAEYKKDL